MHGGLSPDLNSMEQIRRVMRPTDVSGPLAITTNFQDLLRESGLHGDPLTFVDTRLRSSMRFAVVRP